jgi:hypothetical protein
MGHWDRRMTSNGRGGHYTIPYSTKARQCGLDTVFGRHTSLARSIALPDAGRVSKSDLVNPLFEHGHREAQAVALGDCLLLMAEERPTVIDRATGGA